MLDDYFFDPPHSFAFVLVPDFSMQPVISAIEPLRIANYVAAENLYEYGLYSIDGNPVTSSNGLSLGPCHHVSKIGKNHIVILCSGLNFKHHVNKQLLNWTKMASRFYPVIGGLCTGAQIMAQAGILEGYKCTIHWENISSFQEEYPYIHVTENLYQIDRNRITCSGGIAPIDMMLSIIAHFHGDILASNVADQVLHTLTRKHNDQQRMSLTTRVGTRHPKLIKVIELMHQNLENPLSPAHLSRLVSLSTRQLERLFRRYVGLSPKRYYVELRLKKARQLLLQTNLQISAVSLACGFSSPSHFAKCYRSLYGATPYRERGIQALVTDKPIV